MSQTFQRVRGLVKLAGEAVEHGSRAVERVHRATTARPFAILELSSNASAFVYDTRWVCVQ